jgi:hypothetical protein
MYYEKVRCSGCSAGLAAGSGFVYPDFAGTSNLFVEYNPALCGVSGSGYTALPATVSVPPTGKPSMLCGGIG